MVKLHQPLLDNVTRLKSYKNFWAWDDWLDDCQSCTLNEIEVLEDDPPPKPDPNFVFKGHNKLERRVHEVQAYNWAMWSELDEEFRGYIQYSTSDFDKEKIKSCKTARDMYKTLWTYYTDGTLQKLYEEVENIMWEEKKETGREYLVRFNALIAKAKKAHAIDPTMLETCAFFLESLPESYGLVGVEWRGRISRLGIVDKPEAWTNLEIIFISAYDRELRRKYRRKEPIEAVHRQAFNKDGKPEPWSRTAPIVTTPPEKPKTTPNQTKTTTAQPVPLCCPVVHTTGIAIAHPAQPATAQSKPSAPIVHTTGIAIAHPAPTPSTTPVVHTTGIAIAHPANPTSTPRRATNGIAIAHPAHTATTSSASSVTDRAAQFDAVDLTGIYLAKPEKKPTPRGQVPFNETHKSPHIVFLVSNGATEHICNDKSAYSVIRNVHPPKAFHSLTGTVYAKEIGDINVVLDGQSFLFPNAYYLPSSSVNVISQSISTSRGWRFIENEDGGEQVKGSMRIPMHKAGTDGRVRVIVHSLADGRVARKGVLGQVIPQALLRNAILAAK